jgi:hypothetical protein
LGSNSFSKTGQSETKIHERSKRKQEREEEGRERKRRKRTLDLQVENMFHGLPVKPIEQNNIVYPVQKFGGEVGTNDFHHIPSGSFAGLTLKRSKQIQLKQQTTFLNSKIVSAKTTGKKNARAHK